MTTIEHLAKQITKLTLELAKSESGNEILGEILEEFIVVYEILNKYIKRDRQFVTAIIDGEEAEKVAEFFNLKKEGN